MTSIINRTDLTFLMRDWLGIEELFSRPRYDAHTLETTEATLDIAEKIGIELLAPSLRAGDQNEPWLDDGRRVRVNAQVRLAVNALPFRPSRPAS